MADVLDIGTDTRDFSDEGDQDSVSRLKKKVLRCKGRGFQDGSLKHQDENRVIEFANGCPIKSSEGWILFVTSVHEETTEEDLNEKFSEFGHLCNVTINLDRRTGFVKGYAMIEFENFEAADSALTALDGSEMLGQEINVHWCFSKPSKKIKRNRCKD